MKDDTTTGYLLKEPDFYERLLQIKRDWPNTAVLQWPDMIGILSETLSACSEVMLYGKIVSCKEALLQLIADY